MSSTAAEAGRLSPEGTAEAICLALLPDDGPTVSYFDNKGIVPWPPVGAALTRRRSRVRGGLARFVIALRRSNIAHHRRSCAATLAIVRPGTGRIQDIGANLVPNGAGRDQR